MKVIKSRIPKDYVVVTGAGQSNMGPGVDPWETAAYDLALLDAGIENCNIVEYTSVLPPEAVRIPMEEALKRGLFHHGMVLECIKAQMNGNQGQHICAGVGTAQVYRSPSYITEPHELIGGFAAEYEGYGSPKLAEECLRKALRGIFERRYRRNPSCFMRSIEVHTRDLCVDDAFGTVLVALGFVTFKIPEWKAP